MTVSNTEHRKHHVIPGVNDKPVPGDIRADQYMPCPTCKKTAIKQLRMVDTYFCHVCREAFYGADQNG